MKGFVKFDDEVFEFTGDDDAYDGIKSALDAFVIKYDSDGEDVSRMMKCVAEVNVDYSRVFYNFYIPEGKYEEAVDKLKGLNMIDLDEN